MNLWNWINPRNLAESNEVKEHLSDEISKELFGFSIFFDGEDIGDDGFNGRFAVVENFVGWFLRDGVFGGMRKRLLVFIFDGDWTLFYLTVFHFQFSFLAAWPKTLLLLPLNPVLTL